MQSHRFIEQHKIPFLLLRLSKEITALWLYNLKMPGVFTTSFSLKSRQSDWKKKVTANHLHTLFGVGRSIWLAEGVLLQQKLPTNFHFIGIHKYYQSFSHPGLCCIRIQWLEIGQILPLRKLQRLSETHIYPKDPTISHFFALHLSWIVASASQKYNLLSWEITMFFQMLALF